MRAHTITTKASTIRFRRHPRAGPRRRAPGRHREHRQRGRVLAAVALVRPLPTTPTTRRRRRSIGGAIERRASFDFGDRQVGTTSPAQRFAAGGLDAGESDPRPSTPAISVSGDYAQTNNCPPTLSAGAFPQIQGCLITVTFVPTGTGPTKRHP